MQVLKFGGTSVANAENITKTIAIVQKALAKDKTMVVVSALGGTTDMLIDAGKLAAVGNESYKEKISALEQRHFQTVKDLIAEKNQATVLSYLRRSFFTARIIESNTW